jgi:putative transposase
MQRLQAFKYELMPDGQQQRQMRGLVMVPLPQGGAVGIDMGVARFATLSDGMFYAPLNSFRRHETALRRAQQAMSRKVKFSSNWRKAKVRIQRIHARIGNARRDYLHKTMTASLPKAMSRIRVETFRPSPA